MGLTPERGREARLHAAASVVLSAAGTGQVELAVPAGQRWLVRRVTVFVTGSGWNHPTARLYDGSAQPENLIDGTWTGGQDVSETDLELDAGEYVTCVWTGPATSPPAAQTATLRLIGRIIVEA